MSEATFSTQPSEKKAPVKQVQPPAKKPAQQPNQAYAVSKPLVQLTDVELLRGCKTQLRQLDELKNKRGPLYIDERTNSPFSPKAIVNIKADAVARLNHTIDEVGKRGLLGSRGDVIGRHGDEQLLAAANRELKNAVAAGDYARAHGIVSKAMDSLEASFYKKTEPKPQPPREKDGQKRSKVPRKVGTLIPIGVLKLQEYYSKEVAPVQSKDVHCNGNDLVISALEYASGMKWLPEKANWKDEKTLTELSGDPMKLELVKKIMLVEATGRLGELGKVAAKDAAGALAAINTLLAGEAPGSREEYADGKAFGQDWRIKLVTEQGAGVVVKAGDSYSVGGTLGKFADIVAEEKVKVVVSDAKGADEQLKALAGITKGNAIETMEALGVLEEAADRKALRGKNLGGNIIRSGDRFYSLSQEYLQVLPVDARNIARKIAGGELDYKPVQDIIRARAAQRLAAMGISQYSEEVSAYLKGGQLTDAARAGLEALAAGKEKREEEMQAVTGVGALIALEAKVTGRKWEETEVGSAILARCDLDHDGRISTEEENALFDGLMAGLKENGEYRAALRDANGNLDKAAVLAAINGGAGQQEAGEGYVPRYNASGVAQGLASRAIRALGLDQITIGGQGTRRAPVARRQAEEKEEGGKREEGTAAFSTGTWVDELVAGKLPQNYLNLTDEQKQRVQKVITDLAAVAAVAHDADRAADMVETAIKIVEENRDAARR